MKIVCILMTEFFGASLNFAPGLLSSTLNVRLSTPGLAVESHLLTCMQISSKVYSSSVGFPDASAVGDFSWLSCSRDIIQQKDRELNIKFPSTGFATHKGL